MPRVARAEVELMVASHNQQSVEHAVGLMEQHSLSPQAPGFTKSDSYVKPPDCIGPSKIAMQVCTLRSCSGCRTT